MRGSNYKMNCGKKYRSVCKTLVIGAAALLAPVYTDRLAWGAAASGSAISLPDINVSIGGTQGAGGTAVTVQILMLLTVLSLAPAIIVMVTSFTRIAVVLSLLRQALGTPQIPPNQVLISLSIFLTFFIMSPVWARVNSEALQPLMKNQITQAVAFDRAILPVREFMLKLPPVVISLPFKLMLFVLVDGWYLIVGSIVRSFG